MAENTSIEWCDATFNPWMGCTKVSPGCDHCYAEARLDKRLHTVNWGPGQPRKRTSPNNWREPQRWNAEPFYECLGCGSRGTLDDLDAVDERQCHCGGALKPARRRVFCASLADVFDNAVDPQWREDLFELIAATPNLDWLLLTKRIGNVGNMLPVPFDFERMYPNVWLSATIVNQAEADRDIPKLLATPARMRFLSIEPLLRPVSFEGLFANPSNPADGTNALEEIDWVIVGGESGPHARPMHPDWARSLRDQCAAAGVPFLFKQHGEWTEATLNNVDAARADRFVEQDGMDSTDWTIDRHGPTTAHMVKVGKKSAGRLLDGRTHDEIPEQA
jgi:protein gp37